MRANGDQSKTLVFGFLAILAVIVVVRWNTNTGPQPVAARGNANPPAADLVNEALELHASQVASLAIQFAHDGSFSTMVPINGRPQNLRLMPHSVRGPHYRVRVQHADGSFSYAQPQPVRTYRGMVAGEPGSMVAASISDDGMHARVFMADGSELWIEPVADLVGSVANPHAVYRNEDVIPPMAGCDTNGGMTQDTSMAAAVAEAGAACGTGLCVAELACDTDVEYYNHWGSVAAVEDRINSVINAMNLQYEREVGIRHEITMIIVRTAEPDPYTSTRSDGLLNEFRNEWLANEGGVQRDTAQLFTGKAIDGNVIGIAWVSALCGSYGYSMVESDFNGNFASTTDLSAHELGHNWSAAHCTCDGTPSYTMNPYITSANQFHPSFTIPDITAFRDTRTCLTGASVCNLDADCDDRRFCTGVETCVGGVCASSGDPCPGEVCDELADVCIPPVCNNDNTCNGEENCDNCPDDCFSASGTVCGNGVCEIGSGEDCLNCPQDCNGLQSGKPSRRYCCGTGGANPIDCSDARCSDAGHQCTNTPGTPSCCGDGVCQGVEDTANCAKDCAIPCAADADCDDGDPCTIDACTGGVCVNTPIDCYDADACTFDHCVAGVCEYDAVLCDDGDPCSVDSCDPAIGCRNEFPACGVSDGCCAPDCTPSTDADCPCGGKNASCSSGNDCCSGGCKPNGRCR